MKIKYTIGTIALFFLLSTLIAQTSLPLPPHSSTFSGNARGYWFTAPTDMTIVSLRVPTDASSGNQSIVVVKLPAPPPLWSATTTTYTTEALFQNVPGTNAIPVNIQVLSGEVIGVLGNRSDMNSYGSSPHNTTLLGFPITLTRFGMQAPISTTWPFDVWQENGGSISRVEMEVVAGLVAPVPTLGQWGLIILGILVLTFGVVALRTRQTVFAGTNVTSFPTSLHQFPFDKKFFGKMLLYVTIGLFIIFAVTVAFFGYEMTNADVPGSLVAGPLLAYLLHLLPNNRK